MPFPLLSWVTAPFLPIFRVPHTLLALRVGAALMSQPETAIQLGSDTESEDGLREYLAAASHRARDSDDDLLLTPTSLAASSLPDRSGTPLARAGAGASATAHTKRKAAAAPSMPALSDDDDGDGAAPSTPPRGPPTGSNSWLQGRRERSELTPTKRSALPVMSASADDDDGSDGAAPLSAGVLSPAQRGSSTAPTSPTGSPPHRRAPSGAARRRMAHGAAPAAHVSGLEEVIQGLRDLAGAVDPFVVDQTAWERSVILLEGAVQRSSLASVRHTPGISRVAKWTGLADPTGVVMSLLRAFDAAFDELDVVSMQMALDRLNEHPSAAHGRFSAEKSFMKTAVTNARKLHRGLTEEHMGYAAQGALGLYDSGHATLPRAVARNLLHVLRAGVADTILIESLRSDPHPSPSLQSDEQPSWPEYLRGLGIDGASQLEREVAHKVTERPTTDQMKVTRLFELFLTERVSSVVLGMSGVGKTYMAPAWKVIASLKGKRIHFVGPNVEVRRCCEARRRRRRCRRRRLSATSAVPFSFSSPLHSVLLCPARWRATSTRRTA